jgi:hypothetical protein
MELGRIPDEDINAVVDPANDCRTSSVKLLGRP